MLEGMLDGILLVFAWPAIGYLALGVLFGLWLGAVPGVGGITGVIVILPFTFGMEPVSAIALILGVFAVTATSDSIASIMLGIPGGASAQATVVDGHPMAKNGEAARAFGAAFTSSAIGGVLGGLSLAASLPIMRPLIMSFGSPEYFLLGALGLTMVATVSGKSIPKGLAAAALGLMVSQIGFPVASEEPRYWFEIQYLIDGVPLIPLVLGLFAVPELIDLAVKNTSIARTAQQTDEGSMLQGVRDTIAHWWLVLRCSTIGIYIGMLPGLGAMIADWVAYGHVVQTTRAKDDPRFGQGDVRGVIAPESANNAVLGAALIPTVGLGIPGSASMAILLGAFVILGLHPGREMLTNNLDITFSMVWMLIVANVMGAGFLMMWSRQVARASFIDGHLVVPAVLLFILMGAWLQSPDLANWYCLLAFGILGFLMRKGGWPRPPLVLGFVLGPVMESALVLSQQSYSLGEVLSRPMTQLLLVILVIALVLAVRTALRARKTSIQFDADAATPAAFSGANPYVSLPLALILLAAMVAAIPMALPWPHSAQLFPLVIAPTAIVVLAFVAYHEVGVFKGLAAARKAGGDPVLAFGQEDVRGVAVLAWMIAVVALTPLIGIQVAIIGFILAYLLHWGKYPIWAALLYAGGAWLMLHFLYGRFLRVLWLEPLLW